MSAESAWTLRARTLSALTLLVAAQAAIRVVSFACWRARLGLAGSATPGQQDAARRLAVHVTRAAARLPWGAKCLPQAVALSWLLRRRAVPHTLVIAARPPGQREPGGDTLHAWVECGGPIVIGELPGPWHVLARLP